MWNTKQNIESYGKQSEQLLKWGGHSASLDKTKYNANGNSDSLRVATKSSNKQNYKYDNYKYNKVVFILVGHELNIKRLRIMKQKLLRIYACICLI